MLMAVSLFCAVWGVLIAVSLLLFVRISAKPTPASPKRLSSVVSIRTKTVFKGRGLRKSRYFLVAYSPKVAAGEDRATSYIRRVP